MFKKPEKLSPISVLLGVFRLNECSRIGETRATVVQTRILSNYRLGLEALVRSKDFDLQRHEPLFRHLSQGLLQQEQLLQTPLPQTSAFQRRG